MVAKFASSRKIADPSPSPVLDQSRDRNRVQSRDLSRDLSLAPNPAAAPRASRRPSAAAPAARHLAMTRLRLSPERRRRREKRRPEQIAPIVSSAVDTSEYSTDVDALNHFRKLTHRNQFLILYLAIDCYSVEWICPSELAGLSLSCQLSLLLFSKNCF